MRFLAVLKQAGEGCDYTIGCGINRYWVNASSVEAAVEKIIYPEGRDEYCELDPDSENQLNEILLVPAEHVVKVDLKPLVKEFEKKRDADAAREKEEEEREELRRLQSKYGARA